MMDYNNLGSGNGYDYEILKTSPNTSFRGVLRELTGTSGGEFGQQVGTRYDDAMLVDGVLMRNTGNGKLKIFGWPDLADDANTDVPESEWSLDDAPETYVETHPGGQSTYELVGAQIGVDPFDADADLLEMGDVMVYESGASKPSASAKLTCYSLGSLNGDEIVGKDNIYNWLGNNVALRDTLAGREVLYAKTEEPVPDAKRGQTFHKPIWVDVETRNRIIKGTTFGSVEGAGVADAAPATDGGSVTESASAPAPAPAPAPAASESGLESFITTMADLQATDANMVVSQIETLTESEGHALTMDDVEAFGGIQAVRDEILARIEG